MTTFFCHLTKEWVDGNFGKPRRPEVEPEPVKPSGSDFSVAQMSDMVGPEYAKWLTAHPSAPPKTVVTYDPKAMEKVKDLAKFQIDTRGAAKPVESPNKQTWFEQNPLPSPGRYLITYEHSLTHKRNVVQKDVAEDKVAFTNKFLLRQYDRNPLWDVRIVGWTRLV